MEKEEKKKQKGVFVLSILIIIIVVVLGVLVATKVISLNNSKQNKSSNTNDNINKYKEVLNKMVGNYGHKESCSKVTITKENNKYIYDWDLATYGHGPTGEPAPITDIVEKGNNEYEITIYHKAEGNPDENDYAPEETEIVIYNSSTNKIATNKWVSNSQAKYENIVYEKYNSTDKDFFGSTCPLNLDESEQEVNDDAINKYKTILDNMVGNFASRTACAHINIKKVNNEYIYSWSPSYDNDYCGTPGVITNIIEQTKGNYIITIYYKEHGTKGDECYSQEKIENKLFDATTNKITDKDYIYEKTTKNLEELDSANFYKKECGISSLSTEEEGKIRLLLESGGIDWPLNSCHLNTLSNSNYKNSANEIIYMDILAGAISTGYGFDNKKCTGRCLEIYSDSNKYIFSKDEATELINRYSLPGKITDYFSILPDYEEEFYYFTNTTNIDKNVCNYKIDHNMIGGHVDDNTIKVYDKQVVKEYENNIIKSTKVRDVTFTIKKEKSIDTAGNNYYKYYLKQVTVE